VSGRLRGESGMTLVEVLVAIVVMGIVMPGVIVGITSAVRSSTDTQNRSILQTEARAALDQMVEDMRQSYANGSTAAFTLMTSSQVTFTSPDRLTPFHLRLVSYRIQNGELDRSVATSTNTGGPPWTGIGSLGSWVKVLGSVASTSGFAYYDQNNAVTTSATALRTVLVSLNLTMSTSAGRSFSFSAPVSLRNLQ
jgi:prepilin-type N-terminal cleavage/methylation domain-containing protein